MTESKYGESLQTEHPITVSAKAGELSGCTQADCRLWGSGLLRLTTHTDRPDFQAQTILACAGCETCDKPNVSSGDLGIIDHTNGLNELNVTRQELVDDVVVDAKSRLSHTVESFVYQVGQSGVL